MGEGVLEKYKFNFFFRSLFFNFYSIDATSFSPLRKSKIKVAINETCILSNKIYGYFKQVFIS